MSPAAKPNTDPVLHHSRVSAIDHLRGLLMVLMTLDHTRDFFAPTAFDPLDWQAGSPGWFWTRWITHICAPGFILLAGISAGLRATHVSRSSLSSYLLKRGMVLIALELSWVSFSWQFGFSNLILQVIWAIGVAMCVLALILYLPRFWQIGFAAVCLLGQDFLSQFHGQHLGWWFQALHEGGYFALTEQVGVVFVYPLLPWLGLMVAAYQLAPFWHWRADKRSQFCFIAAGCLLALFIVLRLSALYGDPQPWLGWQAQLSWGENIMDCVKLEKYPPSLLYLALTLSMNFVLLAIFDSMAQQQWHSRILQLFGQHAQFYYLLHIAALHAAGNVWMLAQYGQVVNFFSGKSPPPQYQAQLGVCYLAWLASLATFYGMLLIWQKHQSTWILLRIRK